MMWIPVEQIFQLILNSSTTETIDGTRQELSTIEYAFRRNVILVGPVGLLVQLEIIRNSLNIFNIENSIKELQEANKNFIDKVGKFVIQIGDLKTKIKSLNSSFKALTGTKLKDLNDAYVELQKKNEKKPEDTLEKIIQEYDSLEINNIKLPS